MRITQSVSFVAKKITKTIIRKTVLVSFGSIVLAGGVITGQNLLTTPNTARAITPPESCFAFTAGTGTITDYYNNEGDNPINPACPKDVDIPSTIGGVAVTSLGNYAFNSNQLTNVTIPNSITVIGRATFADNQLTTVTIPSSVTSLGNNSFNSNQLTNVTIPNSITVIGSGTFAFNQLTTVTIPTSVTSLDMFAFRSNQLAAVTIPTSVTSVGSYAFYDNQLAAVTIPTSVTSVGSYAFYGNQLTSVTIPTSVTSIYESTFYGNCLTSVTIPNSVTSIDPSAFALQNPWGGDMDWGRNSAPGVWSSDPAEVQEAYDNIWYARLYTEDPANPNNLTTISLSEDYWRSGDGNANGTARDTFGGHIINPASAEAKYVSSTGEQLSVPFITTGQKTNGTALTSYLAVESAVPAPLDPYIITPEEQAAMDAGFVQYYKLGDEAELTAPGNIADLPLLRPSSPHTLRLIRSVTIVNFIYGIPLHTIDFAAPVGSATNPTADSVPSNVAPLLAKSTFSIDEAYDCSHINSASLIDASDFSPPLTGYDTLGGLSFVVDCTTVGGQAGVSLSLGSVINDLSGVKVYKQDTVGVVTDITSQVTLANRQTADGVRTTINYTINDGQTLDDDGLINGQIADPIYLVMPSGTSTTLQSESVGVPNTGARMAQETTKIKALVVLSSLAMVTLVSVGVVRLKIRSSR